MRRFVAIHLAFMPVWCIGCESAPPDSRTSSADVVLRPTLDDLASRYAAARTDTERRDVIELAIDLRYIQVTAPLDVIRTLCGADFVEGKARGDGENDAGTDTGIVNFEPMRSPSTANGPTPPWYEGWYLVVYSSNDQIEGYHLTNIHK